MQAEQAYKTAIRLDRSFSPAYVNLADLYRRQQRDEEGEQLLRAGIEAVAQNADLQHALGLLLVRKKRLDDALPYLAYAAESAPQQTRYAYVYALALQAAGEVERAQVVLEQVLALAPADRELLFALATISRDRGDRQTALRYAERLSTHYPDDPQASALRRELEGR